MTELEFEDALIDALTHGEIGTNANGVFKSKLWTYEADIHTREALWDNFKSILEANNQDKLDHPLSVMEFRQVKKVIEGLTTPYKAGQFLYGYNGVSQVEVDLDDGRHVYLTVFDQDQIGAGNTVYQVVNQIVSPAIIPGKKDRRFDVTLLINGLPIIQIELKEEHHDVMEALNQMHEYINENQYTGIFSTVQILVGMTPYDVRYMANTTADRFNKDFAFHWQKEKEREPVRKWKEFADLFLSIPAAHRISTNYMILDGTDNRECIKAMRPYQVYATKHVIDGLRRIDYAHMGVEKIGYIWHTTGSGKTITSFKTAWLASRLPGVDKVVFLVDRKALTRQTLENYRAYDPENTGENFGRVVDTKNTRELVYKLKEKNDHIVITSVQKLERLCRREKFNAPDRHFVFIVDEAHRSTGGDAFATIQKKFKKAAWVGYTGTPKFSENDASTAKIFGHCLHAYTIKDAIQEGNVLGFKVDFNNTLPKEKLTDEEFGSLLSKACPKLSNTEIQNHVKNPSESDYDEIGKIVYNNNIHHVKAVVDDIYKNWKNRSHDFMYNALLTTSVGAGRSVPMAMMYFDEFQRVNAENKKINEKNRDLIRQHKKSKLPVLKVGITFSLDTSNGDDMLNTNNDLHRAIKNYNKLFGTNFGLDNVEGYMDDLVSRLNKTADDGNYLDLVIVVDQLLTGFDAPLLNTLYVDRMLKGANLIQAYSRTNRIADMQTKPQGNIVNYRWPERSEAEMNKALEVYSNVHSADEQVSINDIDPSSLVDSGILAKPFHELIDETKKTVDKLRTLTNNFTVIPPTENKQLDMLKELKVYNAQVAKLKQYPSDGEDGGYDYDHPDELIKALGMSPDENILLTTTLTNELKRAVAKKRDIQPSDIDLEVEYIKDIIVDYDYLTELIENLMNEVHDDLTEKAKNTRDEIIEFAKSLDDSEYANAVIAAATAIFDKEFPPKDSNLKYPYHIKDSKEIVDVVKDQSLNKKILDFRNTWGITDVVSAEEIRNLIINHTYGVMDLDDNGKLGDIIMKGSKVYNVMSTDPNIRILKKLKYRNALRRAMQDFADHIVAK